MGQRPCVTNPQRWSANHTHFYTCRTSLMHRDDGTDADVTSFGIRSIAVDPIDGLRINGETVHLSGACMRHDNGIIGTATFPRAEERSVEILKAAGFNALQSAHNPNDPGDARFLRPRRDAPLAAPSTHASTATSARSFRIVNPPKCSDGSIRSGRAW